MVLSIEERLKIKRAVDACKPSQKWAQEFPLTSSTVAGVLQAAWVLKDIERDIEKRKEALREKSDRLKSANPEGYYCFKESIGEGDPVLAELVSQRKKAEQMCRDIANGAKLLFCILPNAVSKRVVQYSLESGMTLTEIGKRMGISTNTASKYRREGLSAIERYLEKERKSGAEEKTHELV